MALPAEGACCSCTGAPGLAEFGSEIIERRGWRHRGDRHPVGRGSMQRPGIRSDESQLEQENGDDEHDGPGHHAADEPVTVCAAFFPHPVLGCAFACLCVHEPSPLWRRAAGRFRGLILGPGEFRTGTEIHGR